MNRLTLFIWSLVFFMPALPLTGQAQEDGELHAPELNEELWQELIEDREYFEKTIEAKEREPLDLPDIEAPDLSWLVYVLIGLVVVLLIYFLVRVLGEKQNNKVQEQDLIYEELEQAEENLNEADLEGLLSRAKEQGDMRLILRILYLISLRDMEAKGWLVHGKDKTNLDYWRELGDPAIAAKFLRITRSFEYIWYGEKLIPKRDMQSVQRHLESFIHEINLLDEG